MRRPPLLVLALLAGLSAAPAIAQPTVRMDGVEIRKVVDIPRQDGPFGPRLNRHPIRIDRDPTDGMLYVLATSEPDGRGEGATSVIYRLDPDGTGSFEPTPVVRGEDHGTPRPVGMAFGPEGNLYLVGNDEVGDNQTVIVLRRGTPAGDAWAWSTVATSEPYLLSYTYFDHRANAVVVTPDGSELIVNSGSRSDHGESYGGVREEGLTAVLLRVPADGTDLVLPNDRQALKDAGYVFAEGNRNTADLAFAPNGDLFGPDNAGDRDDPGELNWYREGEHYGFPWRIGGNDTPMQFDPYGAPYGYNGADDDPLVPNPCNPNPADTGCYFSTDPGFPAPPEGVTFVEPIPNVGPYADQFLDAETGAVRDASEEGIAITTFEGGRSPLGITFDADSLLAGRLEGGAFLLSFAGARGGFPQGGQDLMYLDLDKGEDGYTVSTELVVDGFTFPIDAVMTGGTIYVVEYGQWFGGDGSDSRAVWEVTFPRNNVSTAGESPLAGPVARAFPNPTAGALTVEYGFDTAEPVRIELVDVLGRVVQTTEAPGALVRLGTARYTLSTDGLPAGLYVLRLTDGTSQVSRPVTVAR